MYEWYLCNVCSVVLTTVLKSVSTFQKTKGNCDWKCVYFISGFMSKYDFISQNCDYIFHMWIYILQCLYISQCDFKFINWNVFLIISTLYLIMWFFLTISTFYTFYVLIAALYLKIWLTSLYDFQVGNFEKKKNLLHNMTSPQFF